MRAILTGAWIHRLAATLLLCTAVSTPAVAASNPALWKVHDADTTVYLFGTIHAMKQGVHWHFPALDDALAASDTLYIEAADVNPETMQPLVIEYGLDPAHPLSGKLDDKQVAQLKQAAKQLGIPGGMTALNMMRPWLAGITLAAAPIIKAGYNPKLGVDKQLQARFKQAGKPVKGLESARQQIEFLSQLPESVQLQLLQKSLHDYAHADTEVKQLMHAWKRGDTKSLARTMATQMKDRSPELYRVLILNRNKNWSQQIARLMKTVPGTFFIAVGTGHLVGPDRVQVQLRQSGIHSSRLNP